MTMTPEPKKKIYSHAFDIGFEIKTPYEADEVPKEELIFGLLQRISRLIKDWEPDAFHCFDSYMEDEEDTDESDDHQTS